MSNDNYALEETIERKSFFYRRRKRELTAIFVAVVAYVSYVLLIRSQDSPIVETESGKLVGYVSKSRIGKEFYEFNGIPYAEPPVGPLRFEPSIPLAKPWKGIRSATNFGSQCYQIDVITSFMLGSEDCLYLNVFTPRSAMDENRQLPVMVWIHGGGFQSGTAEIYRSNYWMDEEIVIVSVNYRVGALGFLNTGNPEVRGNQGMHDLVQALRWVKANIAAFSGDPNSVTIFGESAGGGAVHYLVLSPLSRGLFHRAISQSGCVLNTWLYSRYPKEQAKSLAQRVNCPIDSSESMVKCLKEIDPREIVRTHKEMTVPPRPLLGKYAPSIEAVNDETTFLPDEPIKMLREGNFAHVPWLIGVDSEEGLPFSTEILENSTVVDWANEDLDRFLKRILFLNYSPNISPDAPKSLWSYFFKNSTKLSPEESFTDLAEIHASRFFFWSGHQSALYHMKHAPVYLYYYNYPTEFGFLKLMHSLRGRYGIPLIETGYEIAKHWLYKLFQWPIHRRGAPVGSSDYEISKDLIKTWVQFAYDPKLLAFQGHQWTPQSAQNTSLRYMKLEPNSPGFIDEPFLDQMKLWNSLNIE